MCELHVVIFRAYNLPDTDYVGKSDPFAVVHCGEEQFKTEARNNTLNPVWNRVVNIPNYAIGSPLAFSVFDKDIGGILNIDDSLGKVTLEASEFYPGGFTGSLTLQEERECTIEIHISCGNGHPAYGIDGGGWRLVRRVAPGDKAHPARDRLSGEEEYGEYDLDPESQNTFSLRFAEDDFDEYMFATGDGSIWLILHKSQVAGASEEKEEEEGEREVAACSEMHGAYRVLWKVGSGASGPWVTTCDYMDAMATDRPGGVLYLADSFSDDSACLQYCQQHAGLNVFVRRNLRRAFQQPRKRGAIITSKDAVYDDIQPVETQMWFGVGEPGFVFPELRTDADDRVLALQRKPDFAVCLSGGGFRATTCALGWVRALHAMGILDRARYLCSNSGGSWFNTCFSYQSSVSPEHFLGPYVPPEELDVDAPHEDLSYGGVVANASIIGQLVQNLLSGAVTFDWWTEHISVKLRAWSNAVGNAFLKTHGLDDADAGFALPGPSTERAYRTGVRLVHQACRTPRMPYPVVVGTLMPPGDERIYHSFEFTPQYCGVPARIEDGPRKLGGILIEPYAASSNSPDAPIERSAEEPMRRHSSTLQLEWLMPLAQMAGISSQYIAQNYGTRCDSASWDLLGCPKMNYWSGLDFQGGELGFADGGGTDNMAVFPPLRRGVRKMLICASVGIGPNEEWAGFNWDISGYFGAVPEGTLIDVGAGVIDVGLWNRHVQVFPAERWDELLAQVLELEAKGAPLIVRMSLDVLPNVDQGVAGGYEVDTVWLFNGGRSQWYDKLSDSAKQAADECDGFPFIAVSKLDYTPQAVHLLSQLSSWNMYQAETELESLLAA